MNIHLVYGYYLPSIGGIQLDIQSLARQFNKKGHSVTIHTSTILPGSSRLIDFDEGADISRIRRYWAPDVRGLRRLILDPGIVPGLLRTQFDVLHVFSYFPSLHTVSALLTGSLKSAPMVYTPVFRPGREQTYRGILGFLLKSLWDDRVGPWLRARADAIIAQTKLEADSYIRDGLQNVSTIGVGIEPDLPVISMKERREFRSKLGLGEKVVLVVGRMEPRKGHSVLIEAWNDVMVQNPDAKLLIVGDVLNRHTKILGLLSPSLQDSVVSAGVLTQNELRVAYASASVTVVPSIYEVTSRVVLEACAEACPVVVTTNVGLSEEITDRTGWVVSAGDPQQLANVLNEALSMPDTTREKGNACQDLVRARFSWDKIADRTIELYTKNLTG